MLAKNVNDNACFLEEPGACEFFASKLAPTLIQFLHLGLQPRFLPSRAWYSSLSPRIPTTLLLSCSTSLLPVW
ncbi:hypothetical protein GDV60_25870 [Pseudomonas sp. DTU12.1]|nr:hypothetical protein GDV60_25870 [Pseudomonas sp. DTU12.1]